MNPIRSASLLVVLTGALAPAVPARAQTIPPSAYGALRWRLIGPHRGGRVLAVAGVPGDPATFYFGAVDGGVWRTWNAGVTWEPVFDGQPIASVGALAVAPSDANGSYGCADHRKQCHVDSQTFSLTGVSECPICGKDACARHGAACGYCGRHVCTADLPELAGPRRLEMARQARRCSTCAQLVAIADPPDEVVTAARAVTRGEPKSSRAWRMARDRSHLVVELDLGLTRKTVFTVRHGDTVPDSVLKHSLLGSKRRK